MTDKKKYVNKFHKLNFKTDSRKDMILNQPSISKNLDSQKITDDFSNGLGVDYNYSAEGEDINK